MKITDSEVLKAAVTETTTATECHIDDECACNFLDDYDTVIVARFCLVGEYGAHNRKTREEFVFCLYTKKNNMSRLIAKTDDLYHRYLASKGDYWEISAKREAFNMFINYLQENKKIEKYVLILGGEIAIVKKNRFKTKTIDELLCE